MADAIGKLPAGEVTDSILYQFAEQFASAEFNSAREWALSLSPYQQEWAMPGILREWAKQDLESALTYLKNDASSAVRQRSGEIVLQGFARRDPVAALKWADENYRVPIAANQILQTWRASDSAGATEYVLGVEDPQRRRIFIESLADDAARRNARVTVDWMMELPPDARGTALNVAAERFTIRDDESRQTLLDYVAGLPEQEISQPLLDHMQHGLVNQRPEESLVWASALPGDASIMATGTILSKWADADIQRATAGVQQMPDGPARNVARQILEAAGPR